MTSIHLTVPSDYKCSKCKKPATNVKTDVIGTPTYARCDEHDTEK